jgi:hypothetical protein
LVWVAQLISAAIPGLILGGLFWVAQLISAAIPGMTLGALFFGGAADQRCDTWPDFGRLVFGWRSASSAAITGLVPRRL